MYYILLGRLLITCVSVFSLFSCKYGSTDRADCDVAAPKIDVVSLIGAGSNYGTRTPIRTIRVLFTFK